MTPTHGTAARFYYHTIDMSGYAEQVEQQLSRSLAEYRPLNGDGVIRLPGHRAARITLTGGALDGAVGANDEYVWARLAEDTERVWAFLPYGDALSRACYCGQAVGENQQRVAGDDIVRLPVAMVSTYDIDRCAILRALAAGGTSPGSTHDGDAASTNGGAAYLICTAISGAGATLTVTIQHSVNGSDWDSLVAMTALTAVGSECRAILVSGDLAITGVSIGDDEFVVAGDKTALFPAGMCFVVAGSTGNDGTWQVASASYSALADETTIAVTGDVTNATVDGTLGVGAVRQYLRVSWTLTGSTPAVTWFAAFGRR